VLTDNFNMLPSVFPALLINVERAIGANAHALQQQAAGAQIHHSTNSSKRKNGLACSAAWSRWALLSRLVRWRSAVLLLRASQQQLLSLLHRLHPVSRSNEAMFQRVPNSHTH